jgi:signal transduction histidine kinase
MLPVLLLVTTAVILGNAASPRTPEYPHVRATNPRIQRLIEDAVKRSATFAQLYSRLQETDVILFVELSHDLEQPLSGRLVFVSATPLVRYLRAEVRADLPRAEMISIIAHEMQHALEIAEDSLVRDEAGMAVLYRHIGHGTREDVFETDSARVIAQKVRRELLA